MIEFCEGPRPHHEPRPASDFEIQSLEPADVGRAAALFTEVFGRSRSPEEIRWKYFEAPARLRAPPVWVAEVGGRLVGQYGGTPTRFLIDGREVQGVHGCDTMTATDFRRRGVLTALGSRAHEIWRRAGATLVMGLVNNQWGSRLAALSFKEVARPRWLTALLRPGAVVGRRTGVPWLGRMSVVDPVWRTLTRLRLRHDRSVRVDEATRPGDEFDDLWRALRVDLDVSVVRDRAWVEWRYHRAPERRYRILLAKRTARPVGYVAFTVAEKRRGIIAEMFTASGDAGARAELLRSACDLLLIEGCETATMLARPGSPTWRSCRQFGFLPRAEYPFVVCALESGPGSAMLSDSRVWTLQGGDFDVV